MSRVNAEQFFNYFDAGLLHERTVNACESMQLQIGFYDSGSTAGSMPMLRLLAAITEGIGLVQGYELDMQGLSDEQMQEFVRGLLASDRSRRRLKDMVHTTRNVHNVALDRTERRLRDEFESREVRVVALLPDAKFGLTQHGQLSRRNDSPQVVNTEGVLSGIQLRHSSLTTPVLRQLQITGSGHRKLLTKKDPMQYSSDVTDLETGERIIGVEFR